MALCVRYFANPRPEEDEASYVSINYTDEGSGAETDNTYESIRSRYVPGHNSTSPEMESSHSGVTTLETGDGSP
ncbi:hypothetical protein ElyMa_002821100 [Elysia marginata]|uniref:Uncharacterized protein n=1 Tax=Elysia marginata TaxID=1093978 RepID=A0AAV4HRI3_9GAST|nr:hypothetical protein ElyMa_002821100 [Elysia marginata]